ncbi:MAG: hypothetical protein P8181_03795 [bacterium]
MSRFRSIFFVLGVLAVVGALSCTAWFGGRSDGIPLVSADPTQKPACRRAPEGGTSVRWVDVTDDVEREDFDIWCATVGPPVAEAHVTTVTEPPVVDSIAFVSWNVHVGGGDIPALVEDLRSGVLTHGTPPDHFVLLLQEVYREGPDVPATAPDDYVPERIAPEPPSGDRIDIIDVASRLGLNLFYIPSMRNGEPKHGADLEDRGNAILSTETLDDLTGIELPIERFRRVAVAATIRCVTPGGIPWDLRLCAAHFATRTSFPRILESAGIGRERQSRALMASLPESPSVLGGDFNTWAPVSMEGALDVIRARFRQPEHPDDRPTVALTLLPDRRLDYLLFDLPAGFAASYNRLDDRYGSDHYPLLGFITPAANP